MSERSSPIEPGPQARLALVGMGAVILRLPRYARLAWQLATDPAVPVGRRAAVLAAAVYLASPIDLVPGIIPFAGQLDDLLAITLAVQFALSGLRPEQRAAHLAKVGLTESAVEQDVETLRQAARWTVHRAGDVLRTVSSVVGSLGSPLLATSGEAVRRLRRGLP